MTNKTRFRLNRIELEDDNIVCLTPEHPDMLNADDMLQLLKLMSKVAQSVPFRVLFDVKDHQFLMTRDARELLKNNKAATESIIAQAVVFSSLSTKILFDLLMKMYAPPYPLKSFGDKRSATEWLKKQEFLLSC